MKDKMKSRKIPTILGILVLVIGIAAGVFLVQSQQIFRLRASPEINPKNIRFTNITDSSFTVSWTTDKETQGFIIWGERSSSLDKTARPLKDYPNNTHSVDLNGLAASTSYFFYINSDGKQFENNGIPWEVKTGPVIPVPPKSIIISGSVLTSSGTPAKDALVYASVGGSSTLSVLTTEKGEWVLPISSARTQNLNSYMTIDESSSLVDITVHAGSLGVSSAHIYIQSARPSPDIILGQVHDFKNVPPNEKITVPEASIGLPEDATISSRFQITGEPYEVKDVVSIDSIEEGEVILTDMPEFFGEGPPGAEIIITIESDPVTGEAIVDNSGRWSWSVPSNLQEGIHKITISWRNSEGVLQTITRTFIVQAQEGPAFVSTPSATPTSTPMPTPTVFVPTPTVTGVISPTPSPTGVISPTPTVTPTMIPTPVPTRVSTEPGLPEAGVSVPTILLGLASLSFIFLGTVLLVQPSGVKRN